MVNISIDGKSIQVPDGTTVLQAARMAEVYIPTLCDHPELTPYGGCRLCLVEVEGARTLQPSCTLPVNNNMIVHTDTEKVREARKFVLTLIFSERNHFCPFCQVSGGDCELQNAAYREGMTHWPLMTNWQNYVVDASHPNFVLDNNRCILCRRCVRACGELVGNFTLGFEERGASSFLVADLGTPLGESTCVACGTCLQVCPTGALIDRASAYHGKDVQVEHHPSVCLGCSVGCGIDVLTRDNNIVRIEGNWDAPVNDGVLCNVGRFQPMEEKRERIVTPMVRKDGKLKAATWDEALDVVATHLKPLAGKNGGGVAALASTRLPSEALYSFKQLFGEKMQSSMVTSSEEGYPTAISADLAGELGKSFEGRLAEINTSDCVLVIGVDLVNNHQVAGFFVKRTLQNGTKLVVIDPQENPLDSKADFVVKALKGTDLDVIHGLSAALSQLGLAKTKAIGKAEETLKAASEKTGIGTETFLTVAKLLGSARHPVIIYGKGIMVDGGADTLRALVDLAHTAGVADESHSAMISTKGHANSLAAAQYKMDKPFEVNGHQAVYIALGDDVPSKRLSQKVEKVPFLVVQASYASQLSAIADVVLPVEMWAEQEGHYLNLEGRLQKASKSLPAPADCWSNDAVLKAVAARLGIEINENWKEQLYQRVPSVAFMEG
ncbi:MAG TPA: molybdopterin-dependent oxidoreductase [Anaerolineaceae bacterium]|nr:molybdopterin-dependent oxidoreductase [Anaerolineaceae bacterium]